VDEDERLFVSSKPKSKRRKHKGPKSEFVSGSKMGNEHVDPPTCFSVGESSDLFISDMEDLRTLEDFPWGQRPNHLRSLSSEYEAHPFANDEARDQQAAGGRRIRRAASLY